MYEHRTERLLTRIEFLFRVARHFLISLGVIAAALGVGVLGYHFIEGLSWIDALVNASMILGGMGPVNDLNTIGGKLFASFYALFSGLIFIFIVGLLLAPFAHRLLHRFHWEVDAEKD
jgi:hypothetical protein